MVNDPREPDDTIPREADAVEPENAAVSTPEGTASPQPPYPPQIGRYCVEGVLGKGGFEVVYLARDDQLQRHVAIKVPHRELTPQPADVEAYLAEMMKGKPWVPGALKQVGGSEGLGTTFLEETFSASTSPPEHRYHQKAARAVLKALLPEAGTNIRGRMRSHEDLLEASGYASRPQERKMMRGDRPENSYKRPPTGSQQRAGSGTAGQPWPPCRSGPLDSRARAGRLAPVGGNQIPCHSSLITITHLKLHARGLKPKWRVPNRRTCHVICIEPSRG